MPGKQWACLVNRTPAGRGGALGHQAILQCRIWPVLLILTAFSCHSECGIYAGAGTAEGNTLRISIERTGGVAGITIATAVDVKDLSSDEAQKLRQMVEESDFFKLPEKITSRSPQPDRFQYELKIEDNGRQHTVTVSEEVVPAKLQSLVKWLMEKARQTRRGAGSP